MVNVVHGLESKKALGATNSEGFTYLAPRPGLEPGTYGLTE